MDLNPRVLAIARALLAEQPDATTSGDDRSRAFLRTVAEQCAYELGPQYGVKRAGADRPQGPSQLAYQAANATLGGWRLLDSDGQGGSGQVGGILPAPIWQYFPGQIFVAVDPVNHLHVGVDQPPALPPLGSVLPDPDPKVIARLTELDAQLTRLEAQVADCQRQWLVVSDRVRQLEGRRYVYHGPLGVTIVSVPEG